MRFITSGFTGSRRGRALIVSAVLIALVAAMPRVSRADTPAIPGLKTTVSQSGTIQETVLPNYALDAATLNSSLDSVVTPHLFELFSALLEVQVTTASYIDIADLSRQVDEEFAVGPPAKATVVIARRKQTAPVYPVAYTAGTTQITGKAAWYISSQNPTKGTVTMRLSVLGDNNTPSQNVLVQLVVKRSGKATTSSVTASLPTELPQFRATGKSTLTPLRLLPALLAGKLALDNRSEPRPTPTPTPYPSIAGEDIPSILQQLQFTQMGEKPADYAVISRDGMEVLYNNKLRRPDGVKVNGTWYRGVYDKVDIPGLPELGGIVYDATFEDTHGRQGPVSTAAASALMKSILQIDIAQHGRTLDQEVQYVASNSYIISAYLAERDLKDGDVANREPSVVEASPAPVTIDLRQPVVYTIRGPSQSLTGEGFDFNAVYANHAYSMLNIWTNFNIKGGMYVDRSQLHVFTLYIASAPGAATVLSTHGDESANLIYIVEEISAEQPLNEDPSAPIEQSRLGVLGNYQKSYVGFGTPPPDSKIDISTLLQPQSKGTPNSLLGPRT